MPGPYISDDDLARLTGQLGPDPTRNVIDIDVARGALPGQVRPELQGLSPQQLGQVDRYNWGQSGGIGGLPVAAGYEALKALQQSDIGGKILPYAGKAFDAVTRMQTPKEWWQQDKSSSPASLKNVATYAQGATRGARQKVADLMDQILGKRKQPGLAPPPSQVADMSQDGPSAF